VSFEPAEHQPAENVARGTLFALVAVPAGVIVWVVLWNFGFIASIVGFGVAYAAMFLYRFGSGGVLSRTGALRVALVTIGTLLIAFFGGVVSDVLGVWTAETGEGVLAGLVSPDFWTAFQQIIALDGVAASYLPDFGLALLFGALGCFGLLRRAFRSTAPAAPVAPPAAAAPVAPPAAPFAPQPPAPTAGADASPTSALPLPPVWGPDAAANVTPQHPPVAPPAPPVAPPAPPAPPAPTGRFEEFRDPNFKG